MILPRKLLAYIPLIVLIMLPSVAFCGVRIVLKNGRSITADGCKERGGAFLCSRAGGFFTVEKEEVAEISKIAPETVSSGDETVVESASDKDATGASKAERKGGGQDNSASQADLRKRLARITKRKMELSRERTKLLKDREKLTAELKKAPDWMTTKQYSELSGRARDIDRRIHRFNEEVSRLNTEGKKINERLQGGSVQPDKRH